MTQPYEKYYVPAQSVWPIMGAVGLFLTAMGAGFTVQQMGSELNYGLWILGCGFVVLISMLFGWFGNVISESMQGHYSAQMDRSFRQGMSWFIFSEVMFFGAFFGALFYARMIAVPWLGGAGNNAMTAAVLWPEFEAIWPLLDTPGGIQTEAMGWYGLPLLNTLILVTSSVTLHFAHVSLEKDKRTPLKLWLALTLVLGFSFLFFQVEEYLHAYQELDLRLDSGIYGNTFFLLTGFHGLHVTLGALMLTVMLLRVLKGHFSGDKHFAFMAASWYWHFVDVVWLCLFLFVYVL
ncbi:MULTISPECIES: cytochrome c oxidase subunit 3 [unclassified Agarivorans]|uniref:cytochrome c oxidase subunit 3 n=1 Tax=unclassified Agarivorans TaxID=2636026 RepID=UPI003D7C3673